MSSRLDKSWRVLASPSTVSVDRCVDIFVRPDGTFGFEEFRRDPEDGGTWTPVAYFSERQYGSEEAAVAAARGCVPWLGEVLDSRMSATGENSADLDTGSDDRLA
jgi:hypothetical protein